MSIILINPPYVRSPAPKDYAPGFFTLEFGKVQRGIPSQKVRTFTATSAVFTDVPDSTDHTILYDTTAHAITVTLPQPAQSQGLELTCKRITAGANVVTLVGTIDGVVNRTLSAQYKSFTIACDGLTYYMVSQL